MKFEAATIKDIAKALGLSTSTISRALRDSYEISAETKAQVLAYAQKINYHPNPIALSLREKRSRSIGVVVAEIANSFYSQVINGIQSMAQQYGYQSIILQTFESYEQEVAAMQFLASRSIDGCLVSIASETMDVDHFRSLHQRGFPLVFFDRVVEDIQTHKVMADSFRGAYEATMHLLENNNRHIAVLAHAHHLSITGQRLAGYVQALQEYGISPDKKLINYFPHGGMHYSEIESAMTELLQSNHPPDGILCLNDKITTGVFRWCREHNLTIPDQLCLAGFSNLDLIELLSPSLSVVRQPAFEMGKQAAGLLIRMIEAKQPVTDFETLYLPTSFQVGESSVKKCEVYV